MNTQRHVRRLNGITWLGVAAVCLLLQFQSACAAPPDKIYAIVTAQILPGKYQEFLKFLADEEVDLGKEVGVRLAASYLVQIGDAGEVVDIWEAPDYNTLAKVFFEDPEVFNARFGTMMSSINIKTAILNPLNYRK